MFARLYIEAAGCDTICRHCWAQGVPYASMPLEDIEWCLEAAKRCFDAPGLRFTAFPMHEVAAHPRASDVIRLFMEAFDEDPGFEPLATTGVPIATREDWSEQLSAIKELGIRTFWVAFHGYRQAHDALVHREGAFEETSLAVKRIRSMGFNCGANVFVTKDMMHCFGEMCEALDGVGLTEVGWQPADYIPNPRLRQYEMERPQVADVLPYKAELTRRSRFFKDRWSEVEAYSEARWVQRAVDGEWPEQIDHREQRTLTLVCRPNFDLYLGEPGKYRVKLGDLKEINPEQVFDRAIEIGPVPDDVLYFGAQQLPTIADLAVAAGDPQGSRLYFHAASMRYRWLDRWFATQKTRG